MIDFFITFAMVIPLAALSIILFHVVVSWIFHRMMQSSSKKWDALYEEFEEEMRQ